MPTYMGCSVDFNETNWIFERGSQYASKSWAVPTPLSAIRSTRGTTS